MDMFSQYVRPAVTAPLSKAEALAVFERFANNDELALNFTRDGCFARAHLMCRELEQLGHKASKAWAFEDPDNPRLRVLQADGRIADWRYHVAPALPVKDAHGGVTVYVFDPSMYDGPVTLSRWSHDMGARSEDMCVEAFGVAPLKSKNDYKPDDEKRGYPGEPTSPQADEHAQGFLLQRQKYMISENAPPRVLFASELRAEVEAEQGVKFPKEGRGWIARSLYDARQREAMDEVAKLTTHVTPVPPPKAVGKPGNG